MEKKFNYPTAWGHLKGAASGYRIMKELKARGLKLDDWDLEVTIRHLLDDIMHDFANEAIDHGAEVYETHGA